MSSGNLSSSSRRSNASHQRKSWRSRRKRVHQCLYDVADEIRETKVDASGFALLWIGVGLQIAGSIIEEMANEMLVEDIVNEGEE
jgi:hypothetical protein